MIERAPVATGVQRHVAIIMDGNRRWARAHALPALEGHRRGMQALERTIDAALRAGIAMLTVYAFSEE
ncbi:MAG TPA: undecaprenyl diphosphate synthase family protein, partial [Xanthomonadales bacterium]|nr:undecaprenyl diphosphate synthase family protein [Xanthomonadales bacterium]